MRKYFLLFEFALLLCFLFTGRNVFADAGPKPSMKFNIVYDKGLEGLQVVTGFQLGSDNRDAALFDTLKTMGPQRFTADHDKAHSMAYGYKDFNRIIIRFNDKERVSNIFERKSYNSEYKITVRENDLLVDDTTSFLTTTDTIPFFFKAMFLTLILELLTAFIFIKLTRRNYSILMYLLLANLITIPLVWFVFTLIPNILLGIIIGELFAFVFEALFVNWFCKNYISMKASFILSFLANSVSFFVGGVLILFSILL
ncbi:hypothetical protein BH10BAC5_BH10BAC5_09460 [soil metagenome]